MLNNDLFVSIVTNLFYDTDDNRSIFAFALLPQHWIPATIFPLNAIHPAGDEIV